MKTLLALLVSVSLTGCTCFSYRDAAGVEIRYFSNRDNSVGEFRFDPETGEFVLKRASGNSSNIASGLAEGAIEALSK